MEWRDTISTLGHARQQRPVEKQTQHSTAHPADAPEPPEPAWSSKVFEQIEGQPLRSRVRSALRAKRLQQSRDAYGSMGIWPRAPTTAEMS